MRVKTYAKLNLYLKIFPRRSDGYHDLVSIMQTVDLADNLLFIRRGDELSIECDHPRVPTDGSNTIAKAYHQVKRLYPDIVKGIQVKLDKRIPPRSGLAGGSGNAAGTIMALRELFKLSLNDKDMLKCAMAVGSDVPFMLTGGCCMVRGRGEFVERLPGIVDAFYLVVVPRGAGVDTAEAYGMFDRWSENITHKIGGLDDVSREVRSAWLSALATGDTHGLMHNDFEDVIFESHPEIGAIKEKLTRSGAHAYMTGSGSAVFAALDDYNRALELLEEMREYSGGEVHLCGPVPQGVEIID